VATIDGFLDQLIGETRINTNDVLAGILDEMPGTGIFAFGIT
jgi:hypothetical protein